MKRDEGAPRDDWHQYQDGAHEDEYDAFRSSDMEQLHITFPDDGKLPHQVIEELAKTKLCQFEDMLCQKLKDGKESAVPNSQRRFCKQMAMAQDCNRILRILREEVMTMWDGNAEFDFVRNETVDEHGDSLAHASNWAGDGVKKIETAHSLLKEWLEGITRDNNALNKIMADMISFIEEKVVLQVSKSLLAEVSERHTRERLEMSPMADGNVPLMADGVEMQAEAGNYQGGSSVGQIGHVVGVTTTSKLEAMRVRLHVALRGNVIMNHAALINPGALNHAPVTGDVTDHKSCFVLYYQSDAEGTIRTKILRLAKAFGAAIYNPDESAEARNIKIHELTQNITDRQIAIQETQNRKFQLLSEFYEHAISLKKFVTHEKLIFYTLNKCSDKSDEDSSEIKMNTDNKLLRALVWVPTYGVPQVRAACRQANAACQDAGYSTGDLVIIEQRRLKPDVVRPTLSRVNRFTEGFQAIVDGYGIPDYKEVNPTIFAIAMFPFLFGVMFGDLIHGLLMTIFAALLIWHEEKFLKMEERNEIFDYMFNGRYTLFMMGICATYMGLIYNEALSCSIDFFGSAYTYSYLCTTSWKGGGSSAFGGQPFPEFGGLRGAAVDGEVQFLPQGCTAATMEAVPTTENCWSYMAPVFDKLPCGTNEKYRCGEEVKQALTCGGQYNLADIPETVTVSKEAFVVPSNHGDDGFLPSDVGQPGTGTANGGHMNPDAAVPAKAKYSPYLFGVDPVWRYSTQNIQFTNSLKMKMSVILGVSQMMVGIILKWFNTIHFKKWGYLGSVCIPELLFMSCTFVYMCMLIFIKWSTDYAQGEIGQGVPCWESCPTLGTAAEYNNQGCFREPPMVITTLIGMFMSTGTVGQDQTDKWERCKFFLFESQESVQVVFLVIALICVPWLFAVEPILVYREHKAEMLKKERAGMVAHTSEESAEEDEDDPSEAADADDGFSMGDVIVGQAIHAIEFILGAVSNTASYLRLWALSLAHSQLSEVFWEYIFKGYEIELLGGQYPGLASGNVFFILACYLVFFACTIAVLMVMESLSAFLHALRLQWVEFQNKFYHATGQKFHPLDFEDPDMPFDMDN